MKIYYFKCKYNSKNTFILESIIVSNSVKIVKKINCRCKLIRFLCAVLLSNSTLIYLIIIEINVRKNYFLLLNRIIFLPEKFQR